LAKKKSINELPVDGAFKSLSKLIKTYENLDTIRPTSFIIWSDQPPHLEEYYHKICHRDMPFLEPGFDHLITAVPKNDPIALAYIQMLITGPFRAFADLISLEQLDGQYFLRCSQLDKWPANVLYNLCIASRVPIEKAEYLEYWADLTEKGYDPTLAFLLSYSKGGNAKRSGRTYPDTGHMWVDPSSNWRNVIDGVMTQMSPSFKEYPAGCRPCNVIWGHSLDCVKVLAEMSDEAVSEFYQLPIEPVAKPPPVPKQVKLKGAQLYQQILAEHQAAQPAPQPAGWGNAPMPINHIVNPFVGNVQPAPPPQPVEQQLHVDLAEEPDDWEFFDEPIFEDDEED
jgi:hypothetical protein